MTLITRSFRICGRPMECILDDDVFVRPSESGFCDG